MKNKETLKQIYQLQYDSFAFKSGLINWYNSLLDKTPDELDENDIAKMLRQNILPALAVQKAIEMIEINLMVGYLYNGELLLVLSNLIGSDYFSPLHLLQLKNIISKFYGNMLNASTMSDEEKKLFIATMKFIMSY
ncbi:contact-dependent growth inhibition system immunity protein [Escherichia coli]|uniref:contact-dependent growth inhibition system immunity protein n=1 Tax=Escherichia coli TaxID=562 RepID=UPI0013D6D94A|nr:contact-dependent growth inhibition system immunity protein [Escherichia coli]WOO52530.1 contact-dependent growth inhibition system immunity protein [Escherichia coli]